MNVPISSTRRAPIAWTSSSSSRPSVVPVSICGSRIVACVSAASSRRSSGGGVVCASAYASIRSSITDETYVSARRFAARSHSRRVRPLNGRTTSQYGRNRRRASGLVSSTRVSVVSRPSTNRKSTAILA